MRFLNILISHLSLEIYIYIARPSVCFGSVSQWDLPRISAHKDEVCILAI